MQRKLPSRRWGRPVSLVILAVLLTGPLGPFAAFHGVVSPSHVGRPVLPHGTEPLAALGPSAPQPAAIEGPFDGRLFNTTLSALAGVAMSNTLAIDPATQTAFSLNRITGNLVAFNISSGAATGSAQLTNPELFSPEYVALDPVHHHLFVSVVASASSLSWILVLDETTLSPVANLTSFSGDPAFRPSFLLYDADSQQVLGENLTNIDTVILNTTTVAVQRLVTFPGCSACSPLGFVDLPGHDSVLLPYGGRTIPSINTSLDAPGAPVVSPDAQFKAGPGAFDNRSGEVWLTNNSATGDLERFTAAGLYAGVVNGPASPTAVAYVWTGDLIAIADSNSTYPGAGWELTTFNGSTATATGRYNNPGLPRWESGYSFSGLFPDVGRGPSFLLTSGSGNASVAFLVHPANATVTLNQSYAGYPDQRDAVIADPANGRYYAVDSSPAGISAYQSGTGTLLWRVDLNYAAATYSKPVVAADPTQQRLFVTFGAAFIDSYSTATGSYLATVFLPNPVDSLSIDSIHRLLYAGETFPTGDNVTVINIAASPGAVVGTIGWNRPPCDVAAISALEEVAVTSCNDTARTFIQVFSGSNDSPVVNFTAGPLAASHLEVDSESTVYATSWVTGTVTVFNVTGGRFGTNWTLGLTAAPFALCVDPADGLGVATSYTLPEVDVVNLTNGSVAGRIGLPTPAQGQPDFALPEAAFYVPVYFTGEVLSVRLIPLPSAPNGLLLAPGNGSLNASWNPSSGSPGFPVAGYRVLLATTAPGTWTAAAHTANLSAVLGGLTNGQAYYVGVEAESPAGVSALSAIAVATPIGVPYPPWGVLVSNSTARALVVSWSPPNETQGAAITNYTVEYAPSLGGPWTQVAAGNTTNLSLDGLMASTTYVVRIVAWNAAGPSRPSATVNGTTSPAGTTGVTGGPSAAVMELLLLGLLTLVVASVLVTVRFLNGRARRGAPGSTPPAGASTPPDDRRRDPPKGGPAAEGPGTGR